LYPIYTIKNLFPLQKFETSILPAFANSTSYISADKDKPAGLYS